MLYFLFQFSFDHVVPIRFCSLYLYLYLKFEIVFAYNAKSYSVAFVFFFSFVRPSIVFGQTSQFFCVNISSFVIQKACEWDQTSFLRHIGKYFVGDLFIVTWDTCITHGLPCALEKYVMAELNECKCNVNVISVFHELNSTLNTIISNHHSTRVLLKIINIFHSVNLIIFTVTSSRNI